MRIKCHISTDYLNGDYGEVEGTVAECSLCGNTTEAYGISEASESRCLVTMRETCPRGETNFYTT